MGIGALLEFTSGEQQLTIATWTSVEWTGATWEKGGDFWDISSPSKIVVPAGYGGDYIITYALANRAYSGGEPRAVHRILLNGTTVIHQVGRAKVTQEVRPAYAGALYYDLGEGDEIEFQTWQSGSSDYWTRVESGAYAPYHHFAAHYLGDGPTEDCSVRAVRTTDFATAVSAGIPFSSTDYDTDSFWSAGDPTKVTIPVGKGGTYFISGCVDDDATKVGIRIFKNGSILTPSFNITTTIGGTTGAGTYCPSGGVICDCSAGDYFELIVNTDISATKGHLPALCLQRLEAVS